MEGHEEGKGHDGERMRRCGLGEAYSGAKHLETDSQSSELLEEACDDSSS